MRTLVNWLTFWLKLLAKFLHSFSRIQFPILKIVGGVTQHIITWEVFWGWLLCNSVLMTKSAFGKPPKSYHTVAVITVKIYPTVKPFFFFFFKVVVQPNASRFLWSLQKRSYSKRIFTKKWPCCSLTWLGSSVKCISRIVKISLSYTIL